MAVTASVLAAAPAPAAMAAKMKAKPHAGERCSIKKKAPKGFLCEKRHGKYVLVKVHSKKK
jgi:hypothetical protein